MKYEVPPENQLQRSDVPGGHEVAASVRVALDPEGRAPLVLQQRPEAVGGHEGQGPRAGQPVVAVVGLAAHPDPAVGTPQPALLGTQVARPAPAHGHLVTGSGQLPR